MYSIVEKMEIQRFKKQADNYAIYLKHCSTRLQSVKTLLYEERDAEALALIDKMVSEFEGAFTANYNNRTK